MAFQQTTNVFTFARATGPILSGADNQLVNQFNGNLLQLPSTIFIQYVAFSCRQFKGDPGDLPTGIRIALGTDDDHEAILPFDAGITTDMIDGNDILYYFHGPVIGTDIKQPINMYVDGDIDVDPPVVINVVFGWVQYFNY